MRSMYRQLRLFNSTASRNADSIHGDGYRSSASRRSSAISGVIGPTFCSYNANMLGVASPDAAGSGSVVSTPAEARASSA